MKLTNRALRTKPEWNARLNEPAVDQPSVNGWDLSWNPDTDMWHVTSPQTENTAARFKERKNAMYWARHNEVH